jgi:hypothetical protein
MGHHNGDVPFARWSPSESEVDHFNGDAVSVLIQNNIGRLYVEMDDIL